MFLGTLVATPLQLPQKEESCYCKTLGNQQPAATGHSKLQQQHHLQQQQQGQAH
jgi:hypothetical protein